MSRYELTYRGKVQAQQRPRGRARVGRNGKTFVQVYDPQQSTDFKSALKYIALMELDKRGGEPISTACRVNLTVIMPIPASFSKKKREQIFLGQLFPTRKPDVDNLMKSVLDGVNGAFLMDDRYVVEATVSKRYGEYEGLHLTIETMDELEF